MKIKNLKLKIIGMHCTSCAMNIDGELEDTKGIKNSRTNYAKQHTNVEFNPEEITEGKIIEIIKNVGYEAEII